MTTQVQSELLADGAVNTTQLADSAVTALKLASNAVTTAKITDANVTPAKLSQPLTQATAQASTSGTSIDFTGIPSWAKRVTVMLSGVSTNGTSIVQIQIGSGSFVTTGYSSMCGATGITSNNTGNSGAFSTGIPLDGYAPTGTTTRTGILTLANVSGNVWVGSGVIYATNIDYAAGGVTLSGALDRVRITTVNGTDTFDAGSINILYE